MLDVQRVTNTIQLNNSGRQLVPRFDNSDRKRNLVARQVGQLMRKFEAMASKILIGWCFEKLFKEEVHPPMEHVIHQDPVRA